MDKRFVSIWFPYLKTDWCTRRRPHLKPLPFVLAASEHGRRIVTAANLLAGQQGIKAGTLLADAKAVIHSLQVLEDEPGLPAKLLKGIAEWCIRFTPLVAIDLPDSIILDVTGCSQLWGSEQQYLTDIDRRLKKFGYTIRLSIADTIGASWAVARFGQEEFIVKPALQSAALMSLPPAALRLEPETTDKLEKLGLRQISNFINMPRRSLRRRFGTQILLRLDQALGYVVEMIEPVIPIEPYQERLPCIEPILTAKGIQIALQRLLDDLCERLRYDNLGLRHAAFKGYREDGKIEKIEIGTNRPSRNKKHLFTLFDMKIETMEPDPGIELFVLEATRLEILPAIQEKLFDNDQALDEEGLAELLDKIGGKLGHHAIHCYLPEQHYWPERSFKRVAYAHDRTQTPWILTRPRPLQLLPVPEQIEVTAPIPDYPPLNFRYKGKLHKIIKADGPERIEQEWWLQDGQHRDYYYAEDEEGHRYWLFRLGHYDIFKSYAWFIHGFFV